VETPLGVFVKPCPAWSAHLSAQRPVHVCLLQSHLGFFGSAGGGTQCLAHARQALYILSPQSHLWVFVLLGFELMFLHFIGSPLPFESCSQVLAF
jgi:hypothetical protein